MNWRQDKSGLILPARLYEKPCIVRYLDRDRDRDRDGQGPRAEGGPSGFAVVLELIASNGAEKSGSVQCTANNDALIHWDSLDNVYRFAKTGTTLYRFPMDQGAGGSAPDQDGEGVRLGSFLINSSASENFDRNAFSIIIRLWLAASGAADRSLWQMWSNGPSIVYRSAGDDTMTFTLPGSSPVVKVLTGIPEDQMITVLMRYNGTTGFFDVYGADGVTPLDSDSGTASGLTSGGDAVSLQSSAFFIKRAAAINGFVDGAAKDALLLGVLTDDPLPVA